MPTNPAIPARSMRWSLEVVRGRDVGRIFEVSGSEVVVGNELGRAGGLDLRDQEGASPRRMAARQAVLEMKGEQLLIRDLDSPGGTFVNRQRLLAGQARRLEPGDQIQLGGVQLRVADNRSADRRSTESRSTDNRAGPAPSPTRGTDARTHSAGPGRLPEPFVIDGAVSCRTWDDFLVVAAQRWCALCNELAAGRLGDYLRRIGRTDLLPRSDANRSLDEQLDQWLARVTATRSSAPEVDVHPARLDAPAAGGTTRHILRITNVGYRLLRCTARVEPAGTGWVKLATPHEGQTFDTVEQTELAVEIVAPEALNGPLAADIVVESNGGTRRVPVRLGSLDQPPELPEATANAAGLSLAELLQPLGRSIARYTMPTRIAAGVAGALAFRALVAASAWLPPGSGARSLAEPRLSALAALGAALGMITGGLKGHGDREGGLTDRLAAGIASGSFGIMAAALAYAAVLTAERVLGPWATLPWAVGLLWAAIGAGLAGITALSHPHRGPTSGDL